MPNNVEEEGKITKILCYKETLLKLLTYYLLIVFSGGLVYLLCKWIESLHIRLTKQVCRLQEAEYVLVFCAGIGNFSSFLKDKTKTLIKLDHKHLRLSNNVDTYKVIKLQQVFL